MSIAIRTLSNSLLTIDTAGPADLRAQVEDKQGSPYTTAIIRPKSNPLPEPTVDIPIFKGSACLGEHKNITSVMSCKHLATVPNIISSASLNHKDNNRISKDQPSAEDYLQQNQDKAMLSLSSYHSISKEYKSCGPVRQADSSEEVAFSPNFHDNNGTPIEGHLSHLPWKSMNWPVQRPIHFPSTSFARPCPMNARYPGRQFQPAVEHYDGYGGGSNYWSVPLYCQTMPQMLELSQYSYRPLHYHGVPLAFFNVPTTYDDSVLLNMFGQFGDVTGIYLDPIVDHLQRHGLVYMRTEHQALLAICHLNGWPLGNGEQIKIMLF